MRAWIRMALFLSILFLLMLLLIAAARPRADAGMEMVRQMYLQPRKIDVVVCGHSQVHNGYNAGLLAERLSADVYVLSSPAQSMLDSFYLLREALKHHEIGTLFLQVNTSALRLNRERGKAGSVRLIHGMRPSANRLEYSLDATGHPFFLVELEGVAKSQVTAVKNLLKLLPLKQALDPDRYLSWKSGDRWTSDRGFVTDTKLAMGPDGPFRPLKPPEVHPDALQYLDRFMDLCDEHGVRVIWIASPYPMEVLRQGDYEEEDATVRSLAEEYGVPYWNFNLARPEALSLGCADYADFAHLNLSGANKLTAMLCDLIAAEREGKDISGSFYASFAERMEAEG